MITASARLPLLIVCVVIAGCAARKPVASNISHSPSYRLESQNGVSVLLSPNIPAQQSADAPIIPASPKIQRRFADSYFPVQFNPDDPDILHLTLVGADRLSW